MSKMERAQRHLAFITIDILKSEQTSVETAKNLLILCDSIERDSKRQQSWQDRGIFV
jgi:hypothetical protein